MRTCMMIAALSTAMAVQGSITFIAPQQGAQAIGPQILEVSTDAKDVDRVEFYVDGILAGVARTAPYRVAYDFGASLEARQVMATVLSAGYTKSESARVVTAALGAGETINVDLVEVPLRVRAARPPRPSDFRLRENSAEQSIREILPTRPPAHFSFVVDRSLSMGEGKLAAALTAVDGAVGRLRPEDTASLTLFNHHVSQPQALPGPTAAAAFGATVPSGGTSLRDAAAASMRSGAARTYVIVITDGGDRNSLLSDEEALRAISGTRSVVSAVVLGSPSSFLERAARNTGGTLLRATRATVREQVRRIVEDIDSRYTVVYQSNGSGRGWRRITVEPRRGGIAIVSARTGYFAE